MIAKFEVITEFLAFTGFRDYKIPDLEGSDKIPDLEGSMFRYPSRN